MYVYVLEESQFGDPWQFKSVFSSQSAAREAIEAVYGDEMTPDILESYRLTRVQCDNGLWGGLAAWNEDDNLLANSLNID